MTPFEIKDRKPIHHFHWCAVALIAMLPFTLFAQTSNVARGKTTKQSSQGYGGISARAVDGNTNGSWGAGTTTHTNPENTPWWEVDLGAMYEISEIKIWNRTDACCWNRLQNFYVMVSENPITANSTTVNQYAPGPLSFSSASEANKSLKGRTRGRFVRIFIQKNGIPLSLAEVEVFGTPSQSALATTGKFIPNNPDPIDEGIWFVIQNKSDVDTDFDIPARRMALKSNGTGAATMAQIPLTGNFDEFLWRSQKTGDGYKLINKKTGEGMAMDCCTPAQNPSIAPIGNYTGQHWYLEPSNTTLHGTNVYTMSNMAISKSKALQYANGAVTATAKNAGDTRQCWVFQPIGLVEGYRIPVIASDGFDRSLALPYGYKVVASNTVSDWALLNAHLIYKNMLGALWSKHAQKMQANTTNRKTVVIISKDDPNEVEANKTPYLFGTFDSKWMADYRGGAAGNGITLVTEEMMNKVGVYHRGNTDKAYREFEQVVHEFAHAIDMICDLKTSETNLANGSHEWFAWKVQFWFDSGHSAGANLHRGALNALDADARKYVGTVFNDNNTWLPPRWLRDR